ncbi:MAG: 4Fe-4S binding protein [Desulfobulbus sp.]|nr:4Fe-4S binding protein [Desulfobulbus sp.]
MERLRLWAQALWVFLSNGYWAFPVSGTLYQGPLKVLCSPGLNCYSCPAATAFCPIGSLQQLLLGVRLALRSGHLYLGAYVLGCMGLMGTVFGRLICGWACPFGLVQELLHRIPSPKVAVPGLFVWGKYLVLLVLVVILPLTVIDDFGLGLPWFCKFLCPAGTLEAGIPMMLLMPDLRSGVGVLYLYKLSLLALVLLWAIAACRPFCRTLCPLGAFYGLFNRFSLIRLKFNADNCTKCGACHRICPVDIRVDQSPNSGECIRCLRCCIEACQFDALSVEIAGYAWRTRPAPSDQPRALNGCS